MRLELYIIYCGPISLLFCYNLSLSGPDMEPRVSFRGTHAPLNIMTKFESSSPAELLYYDEETGKALLGVDDSLLVVDFDQQKIDFNLTLPCHNFPKPCSVNSNRRAYGILSESETKIPNIRNQNTTKKEIYLCIFDSSAHPLSNRSISRKLNLITFEISSHSESWPPKYCSSNEKFPPNFKVAATTAAVSTVEMFRENNLLVRHFTPSAAAPKNHKPRESHVLKLVDTFITTGVSFFVTHERIPSIDASLSRAYVNKISRSCQHSDTKMMYREMKELSCVFTNTTPKLKFSRLVDSFYDHKSHILFGLYSTFDNSLRASALCLHYFEEIEPEKCPDEHTRFVKTSRTPRKERKDPKMPLFMVTRKPYFLTKLKLEIFGSESHETALIYFVSDNGQVLKASMNMQSLEVNLISEASLQDFVGDVTQLEFVGEKLFVRSSEQTYVLPKHDCASYCHSRDCIADYFCSWNDTSKICRRADFGVKMEEMEAGSRCLEEEIVENESPVELEPPEELGSVQNFIETYADDIELSYESLEKHLRVGTLNEAFLIGSISMVLGIIAGVLLLLFIAYIKSSMNHSSSPSLYGSPYGTSNYPTSMANENRGCSSAPGGPVAPPNMPNGHVKYITMDKGTHFTDNRQERRRSPQYASIPDDTSMATESHAGPSVSSFPSSSISLLPTQNLGPAYVKCARFSKPQDCPRKPPRGERLNSHQEPLISSSRPLYTFGGEKQKVEARKGSKDSNVSSVSISELSDCVFPSINH